MSNATLKLASHVLAYSDIGETSNPSRRYIDWSVQRQVAVQNPNAQGFQIAAGASLTLFSGTRSTSIDSTTSFLLTGSTLSPVRYRFTNNAGTAPALRTDRGLNLTSATVAITALPNSTASLVASGSTPFAAVQVGDTLFLPGLTTGDTAGPFNSLNEGWWVVLAVTTSSTTLQLARPPGTQFSAFTQTVTPSSAPQVQAFSAAGVQIGDSVTISAGFSAPVLGTYKIATVTSSWFEVVSTQPLPTSVSAIPDASSTGIVFYSSGKRWVRVEVDQECVVQLNDDASLLNRITPWVAGDQCQTGATEKAGPTWSATVVNVSAVPANVVLMMAE